MAYISRILALCIMLIFISEIVQGNVTSYKGAVANHLAYVSKNNLHTVPELVLINLNLYTGLIKAAVRGQADILVFPEFGLAPCDMSNRTALSLTAEQVPYPPIDALDEVNPCIQFNTIEQKASPIMFQMSCSARENKLSVVINMVDFVPCTSNGDDVCPDDGHFNYNTNVIFDATGTIRAKYHKSHEWPGLLPALNQVPSPDYATYTLSLAEQVEVVFGTFTCYDIFHVDPSDLYVKKGLRHFLYPVQQGLIGDKTVIEHWSKKHSTAMLVSNDCLVFHKKQDGEQETGKRDCSVVLVNGQELPTQKFGVDEADVGIQSNDNIIVASIPIIF